MSSVVTFSTPDEHRVAVMGSIAQVMLRHNQLKGIPRKNAEQAVQEWEQQQQRQRQRQRHDCAVPVRKRKAVDNEQAEDEPAATITATVTTTPPRIPKKARGSNKPCMHLPEAPSTTARLQWPASERPREGATTPARTLFSE